MQTAAPRKVELWSKGLPVRVVACSGGGHDTMAIDEHGCMWGCGRNVHGQLGFGNQASVFSMARIPFTHECVLSYAGCIRDQDKHNYIYLLAYCLVEVWGTRQEIRMEDCMNHCMNGLCRV